MSAAVLSALLCTVVWAGPQSKTMNHLKGEKSPYLLQHVYNPVDWYPWGEEAFAKAKKENKPIFLSIGYSTCHWCHVMERESFTNAEVAKVLNDNFISIKVDREERPDVDKVYMTAANGAGWGGGWPLSIWMTPDRKPFFGGTYFPPNSGYGRPGFIDLLSRISSLWKESGDRLRADADKLAASLVENSKISGREGDPKIEWLDALYEDFKKAFNQDQGGFNDRPKFPMPVNQNFLMRYYARTGNEDALKMVTTTLERMSKGGIYDHVGGGFARYSVDSEWRIPHFEKMLYDNAQLVVNYVDAYQATREKRFARVVEETLDYVLRDMTHPEGGFYSAEDADSLSYELAAKGLADEGHEHKTEGAFYLWTVEEVESVVGKPVARVFNYRYGVEEGGNALEDPHGEFVGKSILYEAYSLAETAEKFGRTDREVERLLKVARAKLLEERSTRPRPGLDDKILSSWNGLMISGFARAYQVLEERRYLEAGRKAAAFLRDKLYDKKTNTLYHRWRDGERKVVGLSDDYAFLIRGLLDLYEASFDSEWLVWAEKLAERLQSDFYDGEGGYYMTAKGEGKNLLIRVIEDSDNVEPAASSVAASVMLRLSQITDRDEFKDAALKTVSRFGKQLDKAPRSFPQLMTVVGEVTSKPRQIIIAGGLEEPGTIEMLRLVHQKPMPARVLMVLTPENREVLEKRLPQLSGMRPIDGKPTAYICVNFACELPTTDLTKVAELLKIGSN